MDSNQKPLPPPPPPPPPPPKNGNTTGRPPLLSVNLHDEGDGGAVGAGDTEAAALCCGSPRAMRHGLSGSHRGLEARASSHGETKMPPGTLVGCPGRDEATAEQRGLPRRHSRVLARLGSAGVGTFAGVDDRPYACADCSMTFGRETALYGHMRSHKRAQLSSEFEEDVPIPKRTRKERGRTVKPLEATWGKTERRNGCPKGAPSEIQRNLEVNDHSDNDNSVIVIGDDDDYANRVITVKGSHGSPDLAPDTATTLAMVLAPAVTVGTPTLAPHGTTTSVNIEGAPAAASTTVETIPQAPAPAPAPAAATTITRAPLTTAVSVATQTAFDLVMENNGFGQAGARHRYGGNGKTIAGNNNDCGNTQCRNGCPKDATSGIQHDLEVNDHSGNANTVIIIDDDDDNDDGNSVIAITGSCVSSGPPPDTAAALAMAPAPALARATPTPAPHAAAASVNFEGAPPTAPAFVRIPQAPTPATAATIRRAPLATAVCVATQTTSDLVKGNNGSSQARARYRYSGNGKAVASRNSNSCDKSLACYGNADYGKGIAGYSDAGYGGKGLTRCSSGSHTYNTSTAAGGENTYFHTTQALGGHITSRDRIMGKTKGKEKLDLQSGLLKCKVCNHECQTGQELSFHMRSVHPNPGFAAGCSSGNPVHQPPHGTMAMAGNLVTGRFSAANTSTGWSLPGTTSTILPVTPLHNLEQNPQARIVAATLGNHGHRSINPALFSFSRRQDIAVVPSNAIVSSSSTPRPGVVADTEPSQAIGINNYFAAINGPANTVGRCLPFFLDGRSSTQALPISWPVHHPTQGMAMDGNPLTGHFPAAISAVGWSFPASANNVVPSTEDRCRSFNPPLFSKRQEKNPLEEIAVGSSNAITCSTSTPHPGVAAATEPPQAAEVNNNVAAIDALCNTMRHSFFLTDRSAIHAPPVSMPVHQSTQGMAAIVGNAVTGQFPTAMAGNGCSFPATTSSVLPTIPLHSQEENPSQGRVVPANGEHPSTRLFGSNTIPTFPSQNQAENPAEDIVAGNNGGRTILRLFGFNIAEGLKEVEEPKK